MPNSAAPANGEMRFRKNQYLVRANEHPDAVLRIDSGWACRYWMMEDGRRQITALYLPGDICEPQWAMGCPPSQPIKALTTVRAMPIPLHGKLTRVPVEKAMGEYMAATIERQSQWLVSLGRKSAKERLAHLFCDLFERMNYCGQTHDQQCAIPLTQIDLADMTGLTPVHINRTLQRLRSLGVIEFQSKWLEITNLTELQSIAAYVPECKPSKRAVRALQEAAPAAPPQ